MKGRRNNMTRTVIVDGVQHSAGPVDERALHWDCFRPGKAKTTEEELLESMYELSDIKTQQISDILSILADSKKSYKTGDFFFDKENINTNIRGLFSEAIHSGIPSLYRNYKKKAKGTTFCVDIKEEIIFREGYSILFSYADTFGRPLRVEKLTIDGHECEISWKSINMNFTGSYLSDYLKAEVTTWLMSLRDQVIADYQDKFNKRTTKSIKNLESRLATLEKLLSDISAEKSLADQLIKQLECTLNQENEEKAQTHLP